VTLYIVCLCHFIILALKHCDSCHQFIDHHGPGDGRHVRPVCITDLEELRKMGKLVCIGEIESVMH
jgi:hypothetical protein